MRRRRSPGAAAAWAPDPPRAVVCGLDGGDLADDLLRLIAAAGLGHHQVAANRLSETEWTSAALVLLSAEAASVLAARPFLPRRAGVLIVGAGPPDSAHWADAVGVVPSGCSCSMPTRAGSPGAWRRWPGPRTGRVR